ncbi:lipid-A-disaccharide synthase N-terminal domain-containing protein [Metallibacterium sp.]
MQPVPSHNMTLMPGDLSLTGQTLWLAVGFAGQALFGMRFLVQWLYSEKHGRSVIPKAFWYLSVAGGVVLLSYAIHRDEPVFIVGEALTLLVFLRNLDLIRRKPKRD